MHQRLAPPYNPGHDFNDSVLPHSIARFRALARDRLPVS